MNRLVLKQDTINAIKNDEGLKESIAEVLDISTRSLDRLLYGNDPKLTQASVMRILREKLKAKQDSELLAEMSIVEL